MRVDLFIVGHHDAQLLVEGFLMRGVEYRHESTQSLQCIVNVNFDLATFFQGNVVARKL